MTAPLRSAQARPGQPHWVVVRLSRGREEVPVEVMLDRGVRSWRKLYRHPTEAQAIAECERLAAARPGHRLAVYAFVSSAKVELPEAQPVAEPVAEPVAAQP